MKPKPVTKSKKPTDVRVHPKYIYLTKEHSVWLRSYDDACWSLVRFRVDGGRVRRFNLEPGEERLVARWTTTDRESRVEIVESYAISARREGGLHQLHLDRLSRGLDRWTNKKRKPIRIVWSVVDLEAGHDHTEHRHRPEDLTPNEAIVLNGVGPIREVLVGARVIRSR